MDDPSSVIVNRIVSAVTAETDRAASDLPPLYEVIDPEALATGCEVFDAGHTTFQYAGHEVTVHADRTVNVIPTDPTEQRQSHRATD